MDHKNSEKSQLLKFCHKKPCVFTLINVLNFMQFFNMQLLGSSMRGLEKDLGFSPKRLSFFIVAEQFSTILFVPVWGILSDLYELRYLFIPSLLFSGIFLFLVGWVSEFYSMFIIRVLNGSMMSSVIPASQKYVALSNMKNAGFAFGIIHSSTNIARLACSVTVTVFASNKYRGYFGWRLCSFATGIACILSSFISFLIPKLRSKNYDKTLYDIINLEENKSIVHALKVIWKRFLGILSGKTIWLIILCRFFAQGTFSASYFFLLYLQYCRFSNLKSGIGVGVGALGSVLGGFLCGPLADYLHKIFPKYGRVSLGITFCSIRLIGLLVFLFFFKFETIRNYYPVIIIASTLLGMTFSSIGVVDRPLIIDIVLPSEQGFAIGCVILLSSLVSCLIVPPLVGYLIKDVFGYTESKLDITEMEVPFIKKNAIALRNGIGSSCIPSTIILIILYTLMLLTYHKDSQAIKDKLEDSSRFSKVKVVTDNKSDVSLVTQDTNKF